MQSYIELFKDKGASVDENDIFQFNKEFINKYSEKINSLCRKAYGDTNDVALRAFKATLESELKNATIAFLNNNYDINNIKAYLLSCIRTTAARIANNNKKSVFICPACSYFDKVNSLQFRGKFFVCFNCANELNSEEDPEKILLLKTFAEHLKKGFGCPDCKRFIPDQKEKSAIVSCPYPDCCFSGKLYSTHNMAHPRAKTNIELSVLDRENASFNTKDSSYEKGSPLKCQLSDLNRDELSKYGVIGDVAINDSPTNTNLTVKQTIDRDFKLLNDVIDSQREALIYHSNQSTYLHKKIMYDAFQKIISEYPREMISNLVYLNRNGGLQHKIFQIYANELERAIPYSFVKNGKHVTITSLLDPNLSVFSGISHFDGIVSATGEIENGTTEYYFGGRKGFYCGPFYIGKLIDVADSSGKSLLPDVESHTFFKIKMLKSVVPTTKVSISHYRIPPHYQMGGMVYLNRIRRKIVDKVYSQINGHKRVPSK